MPSPKLNVTVPLNCVVSLASSLFFFVRSPPRKIPPTSKGIFVLNLSPVELYLNSLLVSFPASIIIPDPLAVKLDVAPERSFIVLSSTG